MAHSALVKAPLLGLVLALSLAATCKAQDFVADLNAANQVRLAGRGFLGHVAPRLLPVGSTTC